MPLDNYSFVSRIDPTKPEYQQAYTSDVRQNFAYAKEEIEALRFDLATEIDGSVNQEDFDAQLALYLPLIGGIMQGQIDQPLAPINNNHLTNKLYVDTKVSTIASGYLPLTGGIITGDLTITGKLISSGLTFVGTSIATTNTANTNLDMKVGGTGGLFRVQNVNAASLLLVSGQATPVNRLSLLATNAGTGPAISANGSDTNIDIRLVPVGTGVVNAQARMQAQGMQIVPSGNVSWAGAGGPSTSLGSLYIAGSVIGTSNNVQGPQYNSITITSDTVVAEDTTAHMLYLVMNSNTGATGKRQGVSVNLNQIGATADNFGPLVPLSSVGEMRFNSGGTATARKGGVFGFNPYARTKIGATYINHIVGGEINISSQDPTGVWRKTGLQIVPDANDISSGIAQDSYLTMVAQPDTGSTLGFGMTDGIVFGGWLGSTVLKATGETSLIRYITPMNRITVANYARVYNGINLVEADIKHWAYASHNFIVHGIDYVAGATQIGNGILSPVIGGIALDSSGSVGIAVAVANGGTGYNPNGLLYAAGGVFRISALGANGIVTAVAILKPPISPTSIVPSNPVATTVARFVEAGDGSGCTLNITWTTGTIVNVGTTDATTVNIGRVGQTVNILGTPIIAGSTGPFLPLTGGILTGALTVQTSQTIGTNAGTQATLRFVTAASSNKDMTWFSDSTGATGTRFRQRYSSAGNMTFDAFDDAGVSLGAILTLNRLTQRATFLKTVEGKSIYANSGIVTWPGATPPYNADQVTLFSNTASMTGIMPAGIYAANYFLINDDTADATNLDGSSGIRLVYKYGGAGTKGPRHGVRAELSQNGPHTLDQRSAAGYFINDFSYPAPNNASMWGINPYVRGHAGATGYGVVNGIEVDITMEAGSSLQNRVGITVNSSGVTDAVQGSNEDTGYALRRNVGNAYPGWKMGFMVGGTGNAFPMDPSIGSIISVQPQIAYAAGDPVTQYPPMVASLGVDFFPTQFNTATFRYRGGMIASDGSVIVGNAAITQTSTGVSLDLNYQKVTAVALSVSPTGTRCFVGDKVWNTTTGTILTITAVDVSNRATAVSIDTPGRATSPPANPVTFGGLNAQSLSINLTWAASTTIDIGATNASIVNIGKAGGAVNINGTVTFAPALSLPYLPLTGGTVTGNVTVSGNVIAQTSATIGTATASGPSLSINGATATQRRISFFSAGSERLRFGIDNSDNPYMNVYLDTGALSGSAWTVDRVTRQSVMPALRLNKNIVYTGQAADAENVPLRIRTNFSGVTSKAANDWPSFIQFLIESDSLDVGPDNQRIGFEGTHRYGKAGYAGGVTGISWSLIQDAAINNKESVQASVFGAGGSFNSGGTDVWNNAKGRVFAQCLYSQLTGTATNYQACSGLEIDVGVAATASARSIDGLHVVRTSIHAYSPPIWEADTGIVVASATKTNNAKYGFAIGSVNGFWSIDQTSGRMIGAPFTNNFANESPMQAMHGLDFNPVDITGRFIVGRGFSVFGSGHSLPVGTVQIGNLYLSDTAPGASIDTPGQTCTAAAIVSGGANLVVGTPLIHDATGTIAFVTTVAAGVATAISLVANSGRAITIPTNPVTFRVSSTAPGNTAAPTAPTLNLTWTASTTINIGATNATVVNIGRAGQTVNINGSISSIPYLPLTGGTVTGNVTITGNHTVTGTTNLGTGPGNYVQVTGSASNPTVGVTGSGTNGALILQAQGFGPVNIRNLTGGIMTQFLSPQSGTIGNRLNITAAAAGSPVVINTSDTAAGISFSSGPIGFGRSLTMVEPIDQLRNQTIGGLWNISGGSTETGSLCASTFQVNDNFSIPVGDGAYTDWRFSHVVQASARGNRTVISTAISQQTQPISIGPAQNWNFVGSQTASTVKFNLGGVDGRSQSTGAVWGAVFGRSLLTGATYYSGATCLELDIINETGSSVRNSSAIAIAVYATHAIRGTDQDSGIVFGGGGGQTLRDGISFGSNGNSKIAFGSDSRLLYMEPCYNDGGIANVGWLADMRYPTFVEGLIRSKGFVVSGTGETIIGTGYLRPVTTGLEIDVGWDGVSAAVVNGGTNYTTNDVVKDNNHGLWKLTATAGVVTALTPVVLPVSSNTPPTNPITLTNVTRIDKFGSGLTVNITWIARTQIDIGPTKATTINIGRIGQTVNINGTVASSSLDGKYLPLAGGTVAGNLTVNGALNATSIGATTPGTGVFTTVNANTSLTVGTNTVAPFLYLNGPAGGFRNLRWQTAGLARWQLYTDGTAEAGGNAGSNFILARYDDAGTLITGNVFSVNRATGITTWTNGIILANTTASATNDLTRHLQLFPNYGLNVSAGRMNIVNGGVTWFTAGGTGVDYASITSSGAQFGVDTSVAQTLIINNNGAAKSIAYRTAGVNRWNLQTGTTETGTGDVGSDLSLQRYNDTGTSLGTAFTITRATGLFTHFFGISFSNIAAAGTNIDNTRHIILHTTNGNGINNTATRINYVAGTAAISHNFLVNAIDKLTIATATISATVPIQTTAGLGVFGTTAPAAKPTISGSRGSALATIVNDLLNALSNMGILTNATTA